VLDENHARNSRNFSRESSTRKLSFRQIPNNKLQISNKFKMSKEFPTQLSIDKAHKEADLMQKKIKSGEAESYSDAEMKIEYKKQDPGKKEKMFEFEMRPEIIREVMSKVNDINKKGTAYTVIDRQQYEANQSENILEYVLEEGLTQGPTSNNNKTYFNIVGRAHDLSYAKNELEIKDSYWFKGASNKSVIIFDIESSKEISCFKSSGKKDTFFADLDFLPFELKKSIMRSPEKNPKISKDNPVFEKMKEGRYLDEDGQVKPFSENGFIYWGPIKQNKFMGIILKYTNADSINYIVNQMIKNYHYKKGNMLLPIYDVDGNLLWPKNMKYDEVKKFVEEREKKEI